MKIAVVILAGGEGSRIGGNKPLRGLGGRPLIDRAEKLARQWSAIVAVAVRDAQQIGNSALPRIGDVEGIEGPLGGLAAALQFARDSGCDAVLTIAVDMPLLPQNLAERLTAGIAKASAAIASSGEDLHPVCGLWRAGALGELPDYLASGRRSLKGFAAAIGFETVKWDSGPTDPFFNVNSPADLLEAERLVAG